MSSLEHRLQQEDQLCFLHIPKTAGSTFTAILDAQFHVDKIWCAADRLTPESANAFKLFRGHLDYDVYQQLGRKPIYLSMLRDPLKRVISLYKFWQRARERGGPDHAAFGSLLKDATISGLKGFVSHTDPAVSLTLSNRQARQIAANVGIRQYANSNADLSDADVLALAKQHVDEFALVGLTERFQESVLLLFYIFGWYPNIDYQSLRVAPRSFEADDLDPETVEIILERNQLDIELYHYAQERLNAQFAQMVMELYSSYGIDNQAASAPSAVSFSKSVSSIISTPSPALPTLLNWLENHYEARYAEQQHERQERIDFDVLQPLSGRGWHRRNGRFNGLRCDGTPFRWTGPTPVSTIDLPLASNQDLTLWLHVVNAIAPDILDSLTFRVNDCPVALDFLVRRGNSAILQAMIPTTALQSDRPFTRLTFTVNRTLSLNSLNPENPDTRSVGLAIHRIQLFPVTDETQISSKILRPFPNQDENWAIAAEFVSQRIRPEERIVAPGEFYQRFPKQFCFYASPFAAKPNLSWFVLHKGYLETVHLASLWWALRNFKPVFQNQVFIIWSDRQDCSRYPLSLPETLTLFVKLGLISLENRKLISKKQRTRFVNVFKSGYQALRATLGQSG